MGALCHLQAKGDFSFITSLKVPASILPDKRINVNEIAITNEWQKNTFVGIPIPKLYLCIHKFIKWQVRSPILRPQADGEMPKRSTAYPKTAVVYKSGAKTIKGKSSSNAIDNSLEHNVGKHRPNWAYSLPFSFPCSLMWESEFIRRIKKFANFSNNWLNPICDANYYEALRKKMALFLYYYSHFWWSKTF